MTISRLAVLLTLAFASTASAQQALLQGGPMTPGHTLMYVGQGSYQPVVQDAGSAAGGPPGVGVSDFGITARGVGTAPYANAGTGPYGTNSCIYDAPITNATGYHYLCFGANAAGGGLIAYGASGGAGAEALTFNINGTIYSFPNTSSAPTLSTVLLATTTPFSASAGSETVIVKQVTPAAVSVVLPAASSFPTCPASASSCPMIFIKDGAGNAATYHITVTTADSINIDAASSLVISANYGAKGVVLNGTSWSVFGAGP